MSGWNGIPELRRFTYFHENRRGTDATASCYIRLVKHLNQNVQFEQPFDKSHRNKNSETAGTPCTGENEVIKCVIKIGRLKVKIPFWPIEPLTKPQMVIK